MPCDDSFVQIKERCKKCVAVKVKKNLCGISCVSVLADRIPEHYCI